MGMVAAIMASVLLMLSPTMAAMEAGASVLLMRNPTIMAVGASVLLMLSQDMAATEAGASVLLMLSQDMDTAGASVLLSPTATMATMVRALSEEKTSPRGWDDSEEGAALHSDRPRRNMNITK